MSYFSITRKRLKGNADFWDQKALRVGLIRRHSVLVFRVGKPQKLELPKLAIFKGSYEIKVKTGTNNQCWMHLLQKMNASVGQRDRLKQYSH